MSPFSFLSIVRFLSVLLSLKEKGEYLQEQPPFFLMTISFCISKNFLHTGHSNFMGLHCCANITSSLSSSSSLMVWVSISFVVIFFVRGIAYIIFQKMCEV